MNQYYTVSQIAAKTGYCTESVRRAARSGKLAHVKPNPKRILATSEAVEAWLAGGAA